MPGTFKFTRGAFVGLALLASALAMAAQVDDTRPASSGWTVQLDPMTPVIQETNRQARRAGAPLFVDGVGFDLARNDRSDISYNDRQTLSEGWSLALANMLEDRGFEITSDARLHRLMGITSRDFRNMMLRNQPYATREFTEQHMGEIYFLLNEHPPRCEGDNGLAALVFAVYPTEDVGSDFGSVAMILMGAGDCASRGDSRNDIRRLKEEIIREFTRR